jgi:tRNA(adenine34) deaminase
MSAIGQSRIKNLYFGAYDRKGGALSLGLNINDNPKLNHKFNAMGGLKHFECSKILSDFFKQRRKTYKL